jgi:hypothetical protein
MAESDPTFKRLARMEKDLADLQVMTRSLLHAQGKEMREEIVNALKADNGLRLVYELVDGSRGQAEIVDGLKGKVAPATVNRKIELLENKYDLIVFVTQRNPGGKVYARSVIDKVLKIERELGK